MTQTEPDYYFFPPLKSEYFFQQHWESELQKEKVDKLSIARIRSTENYNKEVFRIN
jgi:hypothetical protein